MHCPVQLVQLLDVEMSDKFGQVLADVVLYDGAFDFGGLDDGVVEGMDDSENEVEGFGGDGVDGDVVSFFEGLGLLDVGHDGHLILGEVVLLSVHDHYHHS